jgi:hypothetical protein
LIYSQLIQFFPFYLIRIQMSHLQKYLFHGCYRNPVRLYTQILLLRVHLLK